MYRLLNFVVFTYPVFSAVLCTDYRSVVTNFFKPKIHEELNFVLAISDLLFNILISDAPIIIFHGNSDSNILLSLFFYFFTSKLVDSDTGC